MKKKVDDWVHAKIINSLIKGKDSSFLPPGEYTAEYEYNDYGSRGFIDILVQNELSESVVEVKTKICDVGGTIRQIKKGINFRGKYAKNILPFLVILPSNENLQIIKENIDYFFSSIKRLRIFFIYTPELYGLECGGDSDERENVKKHPNFIWKGFTPLNKKNILEMVVPSFSGGSMGDESCYDHNEIIDLLKNG